MPCGYRDQRRQGHRCMYCRVHHSKCDNNRPCLPCKRRSLRCVESQLPSTTPDIMPIEYRPHPLHLQISRILTNDSWIYIRVFFDAIGPSDSPFLSAFCFEEIGQIVKENGPVFDAVAAVGATYASQINADTSLSPLQKSTTRKVCIAFRQYVAVRLRDPHALQDPFFILCVELLAFMELMTDKTGTRWDQLIRQLQPNLPQQEYSTISTTLNLPLLKFIKMSFAFRNLMFSDIIATISGFGEETHGFSTEFRPQKKFPASPPEKIDFLIQVMERWAQLKLRSRRMDRELDPLSSSKQNQQPDQRELEALQIVSQGCKLQQEIIAMILNSTTDDSAPTARVGDSMLPFYHWILTGLCRMFSKSAWLSSHRLPLPVMEQALMNQQASLALDYAEESIKGVQLEAIFYAPLVSVVGVEMSSKEDRERVLGLLGIIQEKGYAVVEAFKSDVRLCWSNQDMNAPF